MAALRIFLLNTSLAIIALCLLFTVLRSVIVYRLRVRRRFATRREFLRFEDTHEAHSTSGLRY